MDEEIDRIHLDDQSEKIPDNKEKCLELDTRLQHLYGLACGSDAMPDIPQLKTVCIRQIN